MATVLHSEEILFMAMELSKSTWKLAISTGGGAPRVRDVTAWNVVALFDEIVAAKRRFGLPEAAKVVSCYEAGREAFSVHRMLTQLGVDNVVVDPASIEVPRRMRRVKTDRLDAQKLLAMLRRHAQIGEKDVWRVVAAPSESQEDERRPHRERERLVKEQTAHTNRIRSLLTAQGTQTVSPAHADMTATPTWDGGPLPPELLRELQREQARLQLVQSQIKEIEALLTARTRAPQTRADRVAAKLQRLHGIDKVGWVVSKELFGWRDFRNRRQVGSAAGLTGTPFDSGQSRRDQGISKAGNRRVRTLCIELAWSWLHHQPSSALSEWFTTRVGAEKGRIRRIMIVALARKLLVALWRYVTFDEWPAGAVPSPSRALPSESKP